MPKILNSACGTARNVAGAARSVARRLAANLKASVARGAVRASVDGVVADAAVSFDPGPLAEILAERANLEVQIDAAARRGHVPDALVLCYFANLGDEVDEHKQRLTEARHRLEASLRRLLARCPEPPAPEPAPPPPTTPPRRRNYRPISDWLSGDGSGSAH